MIKMTIVFWTIDFDHMNIISCCGHIVLCKHGISIENIFSTNWIDFLGMNAPSCCRFFGLNFGAAHALYTTSAFTCYFPMLYISMRADLVVVSLHSVQASI